MLKTAPIIQEEQDFILSSLSPGPVQKRLALYVVLGILTVFLLITLGPHGKILTKPVPAFVPAYFMAMFVCDTITAFLLFAQFSVVRSRAILIIASGYLYTALVLIPWVLTFPGVFAPHSLLGGLQSTSWLYFFQHAGLSLFVIGYALSKETDYAKRAWIGTSRSAIFACIILVVALVAAVASLCIAGEMLLPRVVLDSLRLGPQWPYAAAPVALLSFIAIFVLWGRGRSMLDLWLMVVMFLYTIEIPLSYFPNPVRFSVGWYTVRVIGFMSSCLVLIVLLYEIEALYARLLGAIRAERRERVARLMTGDAVAATIAHEVRQPLTAMTTSASAGFRFLDRLNPNLDRAKEAFEQIVADGHRAAAVVGSIRAMFRNDIRNRSVLDVNQLIREALFLESADLIRHKIMVQAVPNDRLPAVQGDRIQLQQVLLNLITNAIDAMAKREEPRVLSVSSNAYEGDGVIVSVSDTGAGVSTQDREKIFNPLFTTKSDGMGMGLSICRAIIEAHRGRLWVSPNVPQGAVFQFTLRA